MPIDSTIAMDVAAYKSLDKWKPMIGDVVLYNGYFKHWCGIVLDINVENGNDIGISVIKSVVPSLLFSMSSKQKAKSTIFIPYSDIVGDESSKWAVIQTTKSGALWYL